MTLLLREPTVPGDDTPQPTSSQTPEARSCPTCGQQLSDEQDWCLNCGHAAPGRLARGPRKRTVATIAALTLVLCGGAVAAAYAALEKDTGPPPPVIAQAPPPAAAPPAAAPAPPAPAPTGIQPAAPAAEDPVPLPTPTPAPVVTPAPAAPPATNMGAGSSKPGSTKASPRSTTTPELPKAQALDVQPDAAKAYDPYARLAPPADPSATPADASTTPAVTSTTPAAAPITSDASADSSRAVDGNDATSWRIPVTPGARKVGVGLLVDLAKPHGLRALKLQTKTPGFGAEVYATDSDELPPNILDTRWAHLKNAGAIGMKSDGAQRIVLGDGTTPYRYVLLWITTPPADATSVGISELSVLG